MNIRKLLFVLMIPVYVTAMDVPTKENLLEKLPTELKVMIIEMISQANTPDQVKLATKSIHNLPQTTLLNDDRVIKWLILNLGEKYFNKSKEKLTIHEKYLIALNLNMQGARKWIQENIKAIKKKKACFDISISSLNIKNESGSLLIGRGTKVSESYKTSNTTFKDVLSIPDMCTRFMYKKPLVTFYDTKKNALARLIFEIIPKKDNYEFSVKLVRANKKEEVIQSKTYKITTKDPIESAQFDIDITLKGPIKNIPIHTSTGEEVITLFFKSEIVIKAYTIGGWQ